MLKFNFASIVSVRSTHLWEKGRIPNTAGREVMYLVWTTSSSWIPAPARQCPGRTSARPTRTACWRRTSGTPGSRTGTGGWCSCTAPSTAAAPLGYPRMWCRPPRICDNIWYTATCGGKYTCYLMFTQEMLRKTVVTFFGDGWLSWKGACLHSLGSNPDISQKYTMGDISKGVTNTLYSRKKKLSLETKISLPDAKRICFLKQ